MEPIDSLLCPL